MQVRQHEVPAGKHALIHVKQPRGQLVAVRARPATQAEAPPRELRLWQDCDVVQVRKASQGENWISCYKFETEAEKEGSSGRRDRSAKQPPSPLHPIPRRRKGPSVLHFSPQKWSREVFPSRAPHPPRTQLRIKELNAAAQVRPNAPTAIYSGRGLCGVSSSFLFFFLLG